MKKSLLTLAATLLLSTSSWAIDAGPEAIKDLKNLKPHASKVEKTETNRLKDASLDLKDLGRGKVSNDKAIVKKEITNI